MMHQKHIQRALYVASTLFVLSAFFVLISPARADTLGPNLIANPTLSASTTTPAGWYKGGYGTNTRTLTFPVAGSDDAYAVQVNVSGYTSGDAKWVFNDVSVQSGHTYQFSDYFKSNVPSTITIRYARASGGYMYKDIGTLDPSGTYQTIAIQFTVPSNVISLTVFHLIKQAGTLATDQYSLNEVTVTPPPSGSNLLQNGDFEKYGTSSSTPLGWNRGKWGNHTAVFSYPVSGVGGSRAAQVTITNYGSGDSKWYFIPLALSPGIYEYSDQYSSNATSTFTVQYKYTDGHFVYQDIGIFPPSQSFVSAAATFYVPTQVSNVTVFHLINSVGSLAVDNASLVLKAEPKGIFTTGAVSLTFDDGEVSQYENAFPKLQSSGIAGTFYVISRELFDYGYQRYMSIAQIKDLYQAGNEIGAHTRTHPHLFTLSSTQQQDEIAGSRQDLLAMNVGPINSFAYPFGEQDDGIVQIIKTAGFTNARGTDEAFTGMASERYNLPWEEVRATTTAAQVTGWIDAAVSDKTWLILGFHRIDTSGDPYGTTPTIFNQIVDYLVQKKVPVVTMEQGVADLPTF